MALIVRKRLDEWKDEDFKFKLKIIELENFDDLSILQTELDGYTSFLCTLGTLTKYGEELFRKVDYEYPLSFAKIAQRLSAMHFGLLSSKGAKATSCFLYMKTKGEIENEISKLHIYTYDIYRPGFLLNRDGDKRTVEKIFSKVPLIDKVDTKDVARVMLRRAIKYKESIRATEGPNKFVLNNTEIKRKAK